MNQNIALGLIIGKNEHCNALKRFKMYIFHGMVPLMDSASTVRSYRKRVIVVVELGSWVGGHLQPRVLTVQCYTAVREVQPMMGVLCNGPSADTVTNSTTKMSQMAVNPFSMMLQTMEITM